MHVLCVKSNLSGVNAATSLTHGNGIAAAHSPRIAAMSNRVVSGNRKMYERNRVGLSCGKEGILRRGSGKERGGGRVNKVASKGRRAVRTRG